jgi:putative ABC transport system ATP-binding protein
MSDTVPILQTINLSRQVMIEQELRTIVEDFSFTFETGRIYSLLGPSGAGKTSLLRLLNRLDEPTTGEILFEGNDYRQLSPLDLRRRIGYLFQVPYMFDGTVADNLRFARADIDDQRIDQLLDLVSIGARFASRSVANLSVGEKQRIALARLLATQPSAILLDEPTASLDPTHTDRIESTVKQIAADENLTVIMVSHQPQQAARMGGEGILLVAGKLIEHGPVQQLVEQPTTDLGRRYRDRELI